MGYIEQELFKGFSIGDFSPVRIMGVLNLSPESFYKDSFIPNEQLIEKMKSFVDNGATILDLGARSTAPWSKPISLEEEKQRIANSLNLIPENVSKDIIISIDTQYADVAEMSLIFAEKNGIKMIINDISCFKTDPRLKDVILKYKCPAILMATFEKPGDAKTPEEILDSLQNTICELRDSGFDTNKIIIDPGVGKWVKDKTYEYDLAILDNLQSFRCFGCPVLMGLSRKSFLGAILDEPDAKNRGIGSLAATAIAVYNGAHIIRTHDVDRDMVQTIKTASAIRKKPVQVT
ncbi:MAG: dihydropteroate synthase, partial [Promethearchaeota archaeon]